MHLLILPLVFVGLSLSLGKSSRSGEIRIVLILLLRNFCEIVWWKLRNIHAGPFFNIKLLKALFFGACSSLKGMQRIVYHIFGSLNFNGRGVIIPAACILILEQGSGSIQRGRMSQMWRLDLIILLLDALLVLLNLLLLSYLVRNQHLTRQITH